MFPGENPPNVRSPLEKNVHLELDDLDLASEELITKYMFMT